MLEDIEDDLKHKIDITADDLCEWKESCHDLEDQLDAAHDMLDRKTGEIYRLEDEIVACRDDIEKVCIERDELERQRDLLKEDLDLFQNKISGEQDHLASLRMQMEKLVSVNEENKADIQNLNKIIQEKDSIIMESETQLKANELQLQESATYIGQLSNEITLLKESLKLEQDQLASTRMQAQDVMTMNEHSKTEIFNLNKCIVVFEQKLNEGVIVNDQLNDEISALKECLNYKEDQLSSLQVQLQQSSEIYNNNQTELGKLNQMLEENAVTINEKDTMLEAIKLQLKENTVYNDEINNEMAILSDRYKSVCDELDCEKKSNVELRSKLNNLTKEIEKMTEEKGNYEKDMCMLNKHSESLQKVKEELESKLREKENEIVTLNSDLQKHVERLSKNEFENNNILASHQQIAEISQSWESRCYDLQTACTHWQQQCESYQNELQSVTDRLNLAENAAQMHTEEIVRLNEQVSASQAQVLEFNWKMTENEKAQETVYKAKLKNEMEMLNDRFKGVCDELDSEKNSNVQLRTDLSNITKEMNKLTEEKSNYDKHICILSKQSESCQQEIAELESKLREKETEIMRLNSDLQNHVETLSKNEIEYNNILASHQQIVEISRSWENRCNDLQTACSHWHQQCESYQNELQSVTDKLKIAESAAQMQTEDIVRLNENISASQALVLEVNSKLAENEKAQETALERIASLTTETKEKEMELVSLREKLMATEKHLEQFVSEQDSFKKAIVSLETTVTEQNQTNKRLYEDLCTRMAEVEQLNSDLVNTNLSVGNIKTESEEKMQSLENDIKLLNQKLMETLTECQQYKQTLLQLNVSVDALFQEKQTLEQKIDWYHNKYEEAQQEVGTKDHSLMQISEQLQSRQVLMSETENFIADLLNKTVLDDELETNKSNADDLALAQVFNENDADNNIVNEVDVSRRRIQGLLKSLESRFIKQASLVKSVQDNITSKQTLIQNENVLDEIGNNGSAIDTADGIIVETIQPLTSAVLETAGVTQGQTCMDSKTIKIAQFGHNIENVLQDHMEKEVSYEEEISLLQDKIKNLESKAESENELKFETEKLHQLIRSLEEELNTANVDAKDLEKVNISLKSTENELKNQIIQLKKQSQSLHVENDSLRKELKDTSFKKSEENLLLCRERDDNLQRTEQIYRELSVAQSTIMNLQATISQLTAEKQANDDYVKDKLTELDTFKSKLSEQEEVIESLKVELQQLHHLVEDFTAKDHNSQILIAELKEKCNIMKEEADKQNVNMTDLLLQLKDKDVTIASREEECLKMQEKLNTVIKDLENLTMSQNDMQKKFQDQEMESTSMKEVIDTEKEEVQSLYEQMNQLVSEKLDLEMTVEQCKRDLQRAAEEMRKFYQDRENMDEIQQMNENMVIENKALKQVNADFSKQIELNTLRIKELENLLANSNSELSTLKTEFESSFAKQQELEHRVTVLTQNLEEERDQVQSVSGELYAKRESCNKLKVLLEEQNMMVHSLKETITSMSDDVDYSKKQSFNVQSELDQCKVKIGDLLNIIELLKAEKEQVCESNSKLEDIVSEKTRAIHTIFTEVVKMKSEFMKLKTSLQENIQSVNVLHTAVGYVGVAICVANTAERIEGHLVHSSDGVGTGDMADFALEVMKDEMENMSMKAIIDCMKQDLFEWSTQLSSGTQDNTQLYVKVCSLKEEIDKVRNENKLMEARISEMQSESEHAEKERSIHLMLENQTQTETNTDSGDTLKSKIEILEKENATLKQTVNEKEERFTKALATAKKIKFQLTKANESLQKEIALKAKLEKELQDEKEQSVSREQTLQEELNLSVEKICSLHEQLTQSHTIVKNLEKKVLKVESDADNQMKSLLEEHNTALDDVKKAFEEKKSDYNTHIINEEAIKKKEEQIQILSKEIDELRTCLSSFENKTSSMIEAVAGMVVKMTVLNAKLEIQNTHETFEATIDHADIGNLDSLKKDTSTQNKQFESKQIYELQTEFVRLKRMLEQVNMSYETQLDRSDKLQQENESLKCQLTMMQSESYTEPVVVDEVTVETVRPVTSALLESAIGAPVKTDSFADNQSQSVNNDNYQKTEVVYEKEISQCQEKVLNLESDISSTSNMKEVLQERIIALENELSTERGGVHELNMFIISLQNEQQKLIDQVAHLEDQRQALKIENEGFKQELQELVSKKSEERLLFDTENQQSIKRVEELSRELSIAQNTIVTLKDSLKQITTEKLNHDNNERNMLTELDNCRSQLSEQEEKISHLQNDLQQTQYLVEEFTVKDQKSQTLIAELKEQYVMLQNDNASYQEVLEQMKSSNMDLQEVNSRQTIMLKSLQEEISKAGSVSETVEHLRNALNLVNEEKEKLEQDSLTNQAQHGEIQLLVTKLQDENKNLELQLVEMQRNMEMQESQKKILEEQSNGLNSNFEAVQNECKLLEAQTVELRRNVDMLQNEHTIMEEKCASLNNKFEAIQKENGMLEAHNVELNAVVETYQNQKKMLDVQFADLKGTVEGIQNEKEMLEVQLEELSKTVEMFQNDERLSEVESSNLKMNSETIQNINTVLEATNAELSRKVETLENEKKMLASQIMELNCMVESMQHEKENVELQIDDLKRVVETIQPENKMLKDKLNELQTLQHKFTILEEQSVELYNTLEILQNEKKMLESQILELSGTYETLHNEKALLEVQFDQLTKMMKELQNQNEILRTQSSELNTTVETLQSMLDSQSVKLNKKLEILENGNRLLEAQTVELGSTIETLQHEKTVLEAKTEDLEISMEMVQNDKSLFEAHSSELNSNINTLQSRNTTLEAKLLDLCTNLETLKTEKKILEEQSSDLLRNVETLQNKDNMLQTQNRELNIQIILLKNDNKVLEDQILNLNATITSTQAQLKLSENDKEEQVKIIKELGANLDDANISIHDLNTEVKCLKEIISSVTEYVKSFNESDLKQAVDHHGFSETGNMSLKESTVKSIKELQENITSMGNVVKNTHDENVTFKKAMAKAKSQLSKFDALRSEYESLSDEYTKVIADNSSLTTQVKELYLKFNKLNEYDSQKATTTELQHLEKTNKTLLERISQLENECSTLHSQYVKLLQSKSTVETSMQQTSLENNALKMQLETKGDKSGQLHGEYSKLHRQFEVTVQEKSRLKLEHDMMERRLQQMEARCQQLALQVSQLAEDRSFLNSQLGSLSKTLRGREKEITVVQQQYRDLYNTHTSLQRKISQLEKNLFVECIDKVTPQSSGPVTPVGYSPSPTPDLKRPESVPRFVKGDHPHLEQTLEISLHERLGEEQIMKSDESGKMQDIELTRDASGSYLRRLQRWMALQREKTHTE
ncbi:hypothetical protein DPMN_013014 [Dreissena polymorpha]|uniref:Uncharacterized protein n=2 Tax=Dreissena polymorpha TaxID=45954 RepID=A0A9D4N839_DREPO|nr:hypothetical protein DPMN_013014 [Dreissena polymorpha]